MKKIKIGDIMGFTDRVLSFLDTMDIKSLTAKEISNTMGIYSRVEIKEIEKVLNNLVHSGAMHFSNKKYSWCYKSAPIRGTIKGHRRGFGFLIRDNGDADLFIPNCNMNGANHGDVVECVIVKGDEAKVTNIIERKITKIVGTFQANGNTGFIIPDNNSFFNDLYVPPNSKISVPPNKTKVVAEIIAFPKGKNPEAKIVEILGMAGEKDAEVMSILKSYGFFNEFSPGSIKEANACLNSTIDSTGRVDYKNLLTITIDGADSKDLDDAISLEKINDGYCLYVHIADVSHYVSIDGELDKEAYARTTSVYFPEAVFPMLPKEVSNGICSLNPNEDRLTLTAKVFLNNSGDIVDYKIEKSVIKSDYRLTYADVTAFIEGDKEIQSKYANISELLYLCYELATKRKKIRTNRGYIEFESSESKIMLDENGEITKIEKYPYTLSNAIIEDFMLIANEVVAKWLSEQKLMGVFRVHEKPSAEKLSDLKKFLQLLGITFVIKDNTPAELQKVLAEIKESPLYTIVNKVMLRSMQKARYKEVNQGHYGLALEYYCHFTSPIRRYPDLMVHRAIKRALENKTQDRKFKDLCVYSASHSSEREKASEQAERDICDYYKAKYMAKHIGEDFNGVVSGVTISGVYVEMDNTCEGLAKINDLPNDNYNLLEKEFTMKGTKHIYRLGQKVKVQVVGVNYVENKVAVRILEEQI